MSSEKCVSVPLHHGGNTYAMLATPEELRELASDIIAALGGVATWPEAAPWGGGGGGGERGIVKKNHH